MPLVSISDSQRAPLPWANWTATIHHGLPPDLLRQGPGDGGYLAFIGRISPEKRLDRAIHVYKEFSEQKHTLLHQWVARSGEAMRAILDGPDLRERFRVQGLDLVNLGYACLLLEGGTDHRRDVERTFAGQVAPFGVLRGAISYATAYPELELGEVLTASAIREMTEISEGGCHDLGAIFGPLPLSIFHCRQIRPGPRAAKRRELEPILVG